MLGGAGFLPSTVPPPPPFFSVPVSFPPEISCFSQHSFQKQLPNHRRNSHGKFPTKKKMTPLEVDVETLSQGFKDPLDHDFQSSQAPWNHIKNPVILAFVHYLHFVEVVYSRRWSGATVQKNKNPVILGELRRQGMIYFTTTWGAKEPQHPQYHRVAKLGWKRIKSHWNSGNCFIYLFFFRGMG